MSGPAKYVSDAEEAELVKFIVACGSIGYPKTRQNILCLVQRIMDSRSKGGKTTEITNGWWQSFCRRHPSITTRMPSSVSTVRSAASDPLVLDNYFDTLLSTLKKNDLLDKPGQIFNIDETGVPLSPKPPKGIYRKGSKNPVAVSSGDKSQITVVGCVNAAGYCLPPMVIYDRKMLSTEMSEGEIPGTFYGLSDKGWMDR